MPIDKSDFDSVTEQDLQVLVEAQVPEGRRLDFKLTQYGTTDSEKRELLKDVSALANTQGGHLIIGVREKEGIATEVVGVSDIDPDAEIQRVEQIIRSGLDPPVLGIRTKAVRLPNGENVIIIRIPRSFNPPHRVAAQGSNRFYVRNSAGVHEPGIEELRTLFTQSASALKDARKFRDERLALISQGLASRLLSENGRFILHIVPVAAFSGMIYLDVEDIFDQRDSFPPIASMGRTSTFNLDGFIDHRGDDRGYTQVFRNGALEAIVAGIADPDYDGKRWIAGEELEREIFNLLSPYINGLRTLGVPPPLILMATFDSVEDAEYRVGLSTYRRDPRLPRDQLRLPECLLEEYGSEVDHHSAVRPAFDALWNAIGYVRSQWFNQDGFWVGPRESR